MDNFDPSILELTEGIVELGQKMAAHEEECTCSLSSMEYQEGDIGDRFNQPIAEGYYCETHDKFFRADDLPRPLYDEEGNDRT